MTSKEYNIVTQSGPHYKKMQSHGHDVLGVQSSNNLALIMAQGEIPQGHPQDLSLFANDLMNPYGPRKPNPNPAKENTAPVHQPTPVSVLNELCSKAKVLPRFEFTEDGPVHNRRYECQVCVDSEGQGSEVKATGLGKTKKDAKQHAAKNLLLTLDPRLVEKFDGRFTKEEEILQPECDPDAPGNPVGELNEYCLRAKRIVPEYEDEGEEGQPHERVFTVTCKLGPKMIERGRGRSKKQAKRVAAYKMLQRIMVMMRNQENSETKNVDEVDVSIEERLENLSFADKRLKRATDVIQAYRARGGQQLDIIRNENVHSVLKTMDPLRLLNSIVEEQKLKVDWMDLEGANEDSKINTLLTVGLDPMFVFFGAGENPQKSKKSAAENALHFLRLLVKN